VEVSDATEYAKFRSRSCRAVIRVYDEMGNVIETHDQAAISGVVGFAQERRYFVSGKMSFLAEALIVRGSKSAE
jgi:hypothetical protein